MIIYQLIRKVFFSLGSILAVLTFGTLGFMMIEKYPFLDALYMTVITLSTVGFTEVHPLTANGRIFTTVLILSNIIIFTYALTNLTSFFFDGGVRQFFKDYNMQNRIKQLSGHTIVCGYGRIGKQVSSELELEHQQFVVIEKDEIALQPAYKKKNLLYLKGEAIDDDTLRMAGIDKANAVVTTLPSDSDNVFIVLTAREINPRVTIISRVTHESSESKLKRAGCNYVIMPERLGGTFMASMITKPDILQFIQMITAPGSSGLYLEEIMFHEQFKGKSIRELDIRNKTGVNIIGFRFQDGQYSINPSPDTLLKPNTKLIVLGDHEQIERLRNIFIHV